MFVLAYACGNNGGNFYDQSINDLIKQYDEVRKISTGQGDDYTTGCLLDFAYFEKNYRLISVDLSKQKVLDADSIAIQQIIFTRKTDKTIRIYHVIERTIKRNNTRTCKRSNKRFIIKINAYIQ